MKNITPQKERGCVAMLQQLKKDDMFTVLEDRSSDPCIGTEKQRSFDRRKPCRFEARALAFLYTGNGRIISGSLKNISDAGACVELETTAKELKTFKMCIPILDCKKIKCEFRWSKENAVNSGHRRCGIKFIGLNSREKNKLRKRLFSDDSLLMAYAKEVTEKTDDLQTKQKIGVFFLIDLRIAIEGLIDIDTMVEDGYSEMMIAIRCKEMLDKLENAGYELKLFLNNTDLARDIKQRVRVLIGHFLYQSKNFRSVLDKPGGYPGDYNILETIYNDPEVLEGIKEYGKSYQTYFSGTDYM
jgi:hypothetical protein